MKLLQLKNLLKVVVVVCFSVCVFAGAFSSSALAADCVLTGSNDCISNINSGEIYTIDSGAVQGGNVTGNYQNNANQEITVTSRTGGNTQTNVVGAFSTSQVQLVNVGSDITVTNESGNVNTTVSACLGALCRA